MRLAGAGQILYTFYICCRKKFFIHAENSFTIRLNCVIIARGLEGKEEYKRIKRFLWTDILKFV